MGCQPGCLGSVPRCSLPGSETNACHLPWCWMGLIPLHYLLQGSDTWAAPRLGAPSAILVGGVHAEPNRGECRAPSWGCMGQPEREPAEAVTPFGGCSLQGGCYQVSHQPTCPAWQWPWGKLNTDPQAPWQLVRPPAREVAQAFPFLLNFQELEQTPHCKHPRALQRGASSLGPACALALALTTGPCP